MKFLTNRYSQLTLAAVAIFIFGAIVGFWLYVYILETVGDLTESDYRLPIGLIFYISIAATLFFVAQSILAGRKNMPFYIFAINMLLVILCAFLLVPTTLFFIPVFF